MLNILSDFTADDFSEQEQELLAFSKGRVVRIVSFGNTSPQGFWYEQTEDEWVVVLSGVGEIEWADGAKLRLEQSDNVFIPANKKHRVSYTSSNPPCIWLAIYGQIKMEDKICTKE